MQPRLVRFLMESFVHTSAQRGIGPHFFRVRQACFRCLLANAFSELLGKQRREAVVDHLADDLKQFEELQDIVATYLDGNASSKANAM